MFWSLKLARKDKTASNFQLIFGNTSAKLPIIPAPEVRQGGLEPTPGHWIQKGFKFEAPESVNEIRFTLPATGELLVDDVILYEPADGE